MYPAIFMLQRVYSAITVIMLTDVILVQRLIPFAALQCKVSFFLMIKRPFKSKKDLLLETVSQNLMSVLSLMLVYYNEKPRWTSVTNWIFIGMIISTSIISTLVSFWDLASLITK